MKEGTKYIVIEGNIGSGKTTLATKLAEKMQAHLILEQAENNPYLPLFYKNKQKYAFPLEVSLLIERYQQLNKEYYSKICEKKNRVIADYGYFKSLIFGRVNLASENFKVLEIMYEYLFNTFPDPSLIIFLRQSVSVLWENIKNRGRKYELSISMYYLEKIAQGYEDYIKKKSNRNIQVFEVTKNDNINQENLINSLCQMIINQ